jgi:hypothetical protein
MHVVTTPEAAAFIESHGGVAYVRPLRGKCCGGAMTVLSATTEAPRDAQLYEPVGDPSLGVRYRQNRESGVATATRALPDRSVAAHAASVGAAQLALADRFDRSGRQPHELLVELRGRRRPHLAACWDGCVYKL